MTRRIAPAAAFAALITLTLFWIMTVLIHVPEMNVLIHPIPTVTLVDVELEREPPPPPPREIERPKLTPTPVQPRPVDIDHTTTLPFVRVVDGREAGLRPSIGPLTHASANGDVVPLVRVPPRYPTRALARGIEGRVLVEFDVDARGMVEQARVVVAEPPRVFDSAALEAVRQWRYNPRVEHGRPVARRGLRIAIPFRVGGG